jgi:nitrite reductase (NO-forming)
MNTTSLSRLATATVIVLALGSCADDGPDASGSRSGLGAGADAAQQVEPSATLTPGDTVELVATDLQFSPSTLTAEPGEYTGVLVNDGALVHDITFEGGEPVVAQPGERVEFSFTVPADGVTFLCSVPGHADAGMTGVVQTPGSIATSSGGEAAATDGATHGGSAAASVEPDPAAPPYVLRDPAAPRRGEGEGVTLVRGGAPGGGDLIEIELVVEERLMTIAEGFQQQVWTFNGQMPGPVIRTQVGDTVRVHLVNPPEAALSHSVDFHASQVAWNDEMRSIAPGEDLVYEFTTDYAGVWMYHCGTDPVLHHIANGMFGMVIVEPEGGLAPVEHEFFIVQDDWYLGPQGEVSSLEKANQAAPAPDFVMFNGVASQYAANPIEVPTGDDVRFFVLNAGPSIDSSFHIVGTIFDEVVKEGVHLVAGNDGNWGAQAVDLAPAQGAVVELRTAEDGMYPIVTHAFNFPGRGAVGMLQAGDGAP